MRKGRFVEQQIIGVLKEQRAGLPVSVICRRDGIRGATIGPWRSRYGGWKLRTRAA